MMKVCSVCGKKPQSANNKPNSQHKTKKVVYPNLQKKNGALVCTSCIKTQDKK